MPRYEFTEGSSNKFWEITLGSKSFTTKYGKIGANGQTTIKEFGTDGDAKKEYEKLIAEKVKKGYVLIGGGEKKATKDKPNGDAKAAKTAKAPAADAGFKRDARNPQLEAAIVANPADRDAYAVFGDWLQEQGDPRGELISLQLGYKDKQGKALIEKHLDYFLGPLAEHQVVHDEGGNNSSSHLRSSAQETEWQKTQRQAFLWRNGFIYRVRLSKDEYQDDTNFEGKTADILDQVFSHPSGRYVVELAFQSNGDPNEGDLQDIIDLIGKKAPPTVRKITFGDNVDQVSWHHTGSLAKMWKGVPNLRTLEIETGEFDVGKMVAPGLERAIFITGGLSKSCGKNIANAEMPKIKHLEIYYGDDNYGGDCTVKEVLPLLARTDLPKLEYLGLKNSLFSDDIARNLKGAKVLKGLKTLDLSLGTLSDEGAQALAEAKDALAHLEVLDLHHNYLTKDGLKLVKSLAKKVITNDQQEGGEDDRYVAIAE